MLTSLPFSDFKFLSPRAVRAFTLDQKLWDLNSSIGHFLTVDLYYPKFLQDSHSDWPVICQKRDVKFSELSPYTKRLLQHLGEVTGNGLGFSAKKLIATFEDVFELTVHWRLLSLWLELGIQVTRVHNVVQFCQKDFVAPYIRKCIEARREAKTPFEKKLFKTCQVANFCKLQLFLDLVTNLTSVKKYF